MAVAFNCNKDSLWCMAREVEAMSAGTQIAIACAVVVASAWSAWGQEEVGRPKILAALGLLQQTELVVDSAFLGRATPTPFRLTLPASEGVTVSANPEVDGALVVINFTTQDGRLAETVLLTEGTTPVVPPMERAFAMANSLVFQSFPNFRTRWPTAQIAGFGPMTVGDMPAVQLVGTFETPEGAPLVFRHVGILPNDQPETLVAFIAISPDIIPVPNNAALDESYSGWMLQTFEVLRTEAPN